MSTSSYIGLIILLECERIRDLKGSDSEEYKYLKKLHEDFMKGRGNRKELYQEFQNWLKREVNVA